MNLLQTGFWISLVFFSLKDSIQVVPLILISLLRTIGLLRGFVVLGTWD